MSKSVLMAAESGASDAGSSRELVSTLRILAARCSGFNPEKISAMGGSFIVSMDVFIWVKFDL